MHARRGLRPVVPRALLSTVIALGVMAPSPARAQRYGRVAIHLEGGGGTMLSSYQRETMGYGAMLHGAARVGVTLVDPVALQVSGESWFAPSDQGDGQQFSVTGGLRVEPRLGALGRLFFDGNVGLGQSISRARLTVNGGVGMEFALGRGFALGPAARFGALFAAASDHPSDALYWSAGLSASWRYERRDAPPPPPPPRPTDRDQDGVTDAADLCPDEPAGAEPDPARAGCPRRDRDGDGLWDSLDACPDVPLGEHPDPSRLGCPLPDEDRDGVYGTSDLCPTVAQGPVADPARPGCPAPDQDGDGIHDPLDRCPDVAAGGHPDPARLGCPMSDRDADSVPDSADACPDRPGAPSTHAARNGCPGLVRIERGMIRILRPVFFATNRDTILRRSNAVLAAVADALRADPSLHRVAVEGHTDDVADDAFNLDLSSRRAARVQEDLVRRGITAERLSSQGFGETRPAVPGRSARARATNRRVEFRIVAVVASAAGGAR